jgi:signal transduction histidine kinase
VTVQGSTPPLRTVSLRRRVVLSSLAVLGVVLVLVGALALLFTGVGARADLRGQLTTRAALATQLAAQHVPPDTIVDRVRGPAVRVRLVDASGLTYGSTGPESRGGPVVRRALPGGLELTLVGDPALLAGAQARLSRLLVMLGIGGLGVAAVALLASTRVALRPLDSMTALARSIAAGDRGRRLAPTRPNTELGRTATAFDDMLDALEGAERTAQESEAVARRSEERTRRFVADAAHELRTPIAGLRAAAEAALSSRAGPEERDRLHLLLIREAGRAGRLVEDLLAMAQIDAGLGLERAPVNLRELAETEVDRIHLLAPAITLRVLGEAPTVSGDPRRLGQVLANLLGNARRHTPDGGEVTVTLDRPAEHTARVRVADTGPGVPEPDRERIFERLVRLDDARSRDPASPGSGGAGLGLAIARGIARAHGGELRCGPDSTFELTLPTG